jgi:mediator of RNA polymerase II transcription subunit 10
MARPTITIPPPVPSTPLANGSSGYGFPAAESPGRAGSESPPPEGTQGALEMELLGLAHALYALGTTAVLDATRDAGSTAPSPNNSHNHTPMNGNSAATQGKPVGARANDVVRALAAVDKMSDEFGRVMVPLDVLREVDAGQNPGRVSAARLERAVGENQFMNGKISAVQVCHISFPFSR